MYTLHKYGGWCMHFKLKNIPYSIQWSKTNWLFFAWLQTIKGIQFDTIAFFYKLFTEFYGIDSIRFPQQQKLDNYLLIKQTNYLNVEVVKVIF